MKTSPFSYTILLHVVICGTLFTFSPSYISARFSARLKLSYSTTATKFTKLLPVSWNNDSAKLIQGQLTNCCNSTLYAGTIAKAVEFLRLTHIKRNMPPKEPALAALDASCLYEQTRFATRLPLFCFLNFSDVRDVILLINN